MATPWERAGISRNQLDRAGRLLRDWMVGGLLVDPEVLAALDTLDAYRAEFTEPLTKVVMGLRSAVATEGAPVVVAQRLKRQPRVVAKLARFPAMELSRMQDIGGCRAILPDPGTVDAVHRRVLRHKSEVVRVDDYNSSPRSSGYRALHMIVRRDGALVEIQLRTPWQQQWATLVEDLDGTLGLTLKDERGPDELLRYLQALAYAQDRVYGGAGLSKVERESLGSSRMRAEAWLRSRGAIR